MQANNTYKQHGFVSFITVIFLAGILALITTAFVRAMISNQRQTLDSQLSTQAFYAAESGVNDLLDYMQNGGTPVYGTNNCNDNILKIHNNATGKNVLDGSANIKYTCLLVNSEIDSIKFPSDVNQGKIYKIKSSNGAIINRIKVAWGDKDQNNARNNTDISLPAFSNWGSNIPALLRVTLYYPPEGNFSRSNIVSNQRTYFLIPSRSPSISVINVGTEDAAKINIQCDTATADLDYRCQADIMIPSSEKEFYVRIRPIYIGSDVEIRGFAATSPAGKSEKLIGAQTVIDSTGRANDVYKRIEVRKDITADYGLPDYVVRTNDSICKQFAIWGDGAGERRDFGIGGCSF